MISKNQIKIINSLTQKKMRDELGLFVAEGTKLVLDLMPIFQLRECYATPDWIVAHKHVCIASVQEVTTEELHKLSNQKNPQGVFAVFEKPQVNLNVNLEADLSIALDDVQDPGNLGTIIRIADWFGIRHVFCSLLSADAFSPKTVQATMGALARVQVHYVDLESYIKRLPASVPVYGTFMDGVDMYSEKLNGNGLIVMGNEGNGISDKIAKLVTNRISIPNYPKNQATSESLNVAMAAGIICAEFRRRLI
jgi:RNA methyltransferase, TrmH family